MPVCVREPVRACSAGCSAACLFRRPDIANANLASSQAQKLARLARQGHAPIAQHLCIVSSRAQQISWQIAHDA